MELRPQPSADLPVVSYPGPVSRAGGHRLMDGRSYMDDNPFSRTAKWEDPLGGRRLHSRVDYVTTVVLSGKDASGAPFREITQTSSVNLHGCRLRSAYQILVGMLVTLECPQAGTSGKGVCARVWDAEPGASGHEIAIQLIRPQNLWGVPNPPVDWEKAAKEMLRGRTMQTERAALIASPAAPRAPAPVSLPRIPAIPQVAAPTPPAVAESAALATVGPTAVADPSIEQRLAELERRSTQLVESTLKALRGQAEQLSRKSLEEFRQQAESIIQEAEGRMRNGLQQAYEDSAASLMDLRTNLMDQLASRGAQLIRSTEDSMRTRLRGQPAIEDKTAPAIPPVKVKKA